MNNSLLFIAIIFVLLTLLLLLQRANTSRVKAEKRKVFSGSHDCGLRAIVALFPKVDEERLRETFLNCSESWPYEGGVSNLEFNVGLRHLGLFEKFEYNEANQTVGQLLEKQNKTFIALIHGHFTVIDRGRIEDDPAYRLIQSDTFVYCSWRLK